MSSNPNNTAQNLMAPPLPHPHQIPGHPNPMAPPNPMATMPPPPTGQPGFVPPLTPHGTLPLPPPPPTGHHQSMPPPPEMQSLMDKTAQKTVQSQNAFEFEELIRRKQASNPQFAFLFRGHPWNHYYEWKKVTLQQMQNNKNNNNIHKKHVPTESTDAKSTDNSNNNEQTDNSINVKIPKKKINQKQKQ